jgi:hypothetical protein
MEAMNNSTSSGHPVTVSHLPLVRCAVCRRTVAHRPVEASAVLTSHYEKAHPEIVGSEQRHAPQHAPGLAASAPTR